MSSNHTRIGAWVNSKMSGRNPPVYGTIPLIAMQGYQTKTEDTISLDYNSISYITSRIGWVSIKGIFKYRCRRRDPGKLCNNYCYTRYILSERIAHACCRSRVLYPVSLLLYFYLAVWCVAFVVLALACPLILMYYY